MNAPSDDLSPRADEFFARSRHETYLDGDRLFTKLFVAQWLGCTILAIARSPLMWDGDASTIDPHVYAAISIGGLITVPTLWLARTYRGHALTRHVMAVAQTCWSALVIHLTDGRIESHFHVFGSLAFLAFYRDWKLLITATLSVSADHLIRGTLAPESVYGVTNPEWWRFLEHGAWVAFENVVLLLGIVASVREMRSLSSRQAELERTNASIESKVAERTRDLAESREQYRLFVEGTHAIPFELDLGEGYFAYVGHQAFERGIVSEESCAHPGYIDELFPRERHASFRQQLDACRDGSYDLECALTTADSRLLELRWVVSAQTKNGITRLRGLMLDVTEQRRLVRDLAQAQKLESVGRLASGVAHEINTPVQFVADSVHFVRDAMNDVLDVLASYRALRTAVETDGDARGAAVATADAEESADIDYVLDNAPKALDRALEGLERVATIVRSMKDFAHPDRRAKSETDLNRAIESTLTIARNEYKYVADVVTEYGALPLVPSFAGELNQVVLNLVVNAAHAIADRVSGTTNRGLITVRTRAASDFVEIELSDTGTGIPVAARAHIFDPFFTTKEVGRGTGQGLAIARSVIEDKHGGTLRFETELGVGTTFHITLPLAPSTLAQSTRGEAA